ncbi:hypothetical protein GEMRC1_002773 [Eukaryota sp. GEM-RC1]
MSLKQLKNEIEDLEAALFITPGDSDLELKIKTLKKEYTALKKDPSRQVEIPAHVAAPTQAPLAAAAEKPKSTPIKQVSSTSQPPASIPSPKAEELVPDLSDEELKIVLDNVIKRRFLFTPAFEIYGGVSGLYDYGPVLAGVKRNIINMWVKCFINTQPNVFEIACTALTPEAVFEASGHVQKFSDLMVRDSVTKECYRADQLLIAHLETLAENKDLPADEHKTISHVISTADACDAIQMAELINKYELLSPNGNLLSDPVPLNLMFSTFIGPLGSSKGFLRPETAQGIFVNFQRLFEFNNKSLPFGVAQIGTAFRNEISPRAGLIRLREFSMAEIEYFIDPEDTTHQEYLDFAETQIIWLPRDLQEQDGADAEGIDMILDDALSHGFVQTEVMAYFIGKVQVFLEVLGINPEKIRFRQHLSSQMAHYAEDCWDAEVLLSSGWTEIVGIADRSCYDLKCHSEASKTDLSVTKDLEKPIIKNFFSFEFNKKVAGKKFKKDLVLLQQYFESKTEEELHDLADQMSTDGQLVVELEDTTITVASEDIEFKQVEEKQFVRKFLPRVIEPSFGIDRIVYAVLEHSMYVRKIGGGRELDRSVLRFPAEIAPCKVVVMPLFSQQAYKDFTAEICSVLSHDEIPYRIDNNQSIGKRYARADEIGVPYAVTIDQQSLKTDKITLRERDSGEQVYVHIEELGDCLQNLIEGWEWSDCKKKYRVVKK